MTTIRVPITTRKITNNTISEYESRFTADRLGGGKKCIDFVF